MSTRSLVVTSALAVALGLGGCMAPDDPATYEQQQQPIIGGEETSEFPAVALLEIGQARCTATLIADTVMLTAAHCVYDAWVEGRRTGLAFFGPSRSEGERIEVDNVIPHFLYRPEHIREADIGLVRLATAPTNVQPMAWNREAVVQGLLGSDVVAVGFGVTDGESQTGAGAKRQVALTVDEVQEALIGVGDDVANICQGDSGGPTFLDIDGVTTVLGVSSFGSNFCQNRSYLTRSDIFVDFIDEVTAAWSGPCQVDATCVTSGCGAFPDPDCGVCGLEGVCGQDCATRDLDCPPLGVPGDLCESDEDCELGMCIATEDNPSISICSEPCDPDGTGSDCSRAPDLCVERDGEGVCMYPGITPTTQGAPCEEPGDCRSGICDSRYDMCVETCEGSCNPPYSCEKLDEIRVCTFEQGGCCSLTPGGSGEPLPWGGILVGAFVMLFLWRARRQVR